MALRARQLGLPALLLLAVLLRFVTLGHQSLWLDEWATAQAVGLPFKDMLTFVGRIETTPAFFFILTWGWTKVAGHGDAMVRMVSLFAGLAVIPVALAFGRRLAGEAAGWVLAGIAVVHPLLVWYSQDARSYSLALLFGSLGWLTFLRTLDRPHQEEVLWWALASGAGAVTHFTTVYFAIAQGVYMFVTRPQIRRPLLLAGAGLGLVGIGLAPHAATVNDARTGWIHLIPLGDRLEAAVRDGLAGPSLPTWHPAALAALAGGLASLPVLVRPDRKRIVVPAILAVVGVGLGLIVRETGGDYILGRNLIAAWLPLWALAAAGLAYLPRQWMAAAGAGVVCALLLAITMVDLTDDRQQRPNWQAVAEGIGPGLPSAYRVIVGPAQLASRPLARYLPLQERTPGMVWPTNHVVLISPLTAKFARPCGGGALCSLYPTVVRDEPLPGLRKVGERKVANGRFLLVTYHSKRPVTVDDATVPLFGMQDYGPGPTTTFLQAPG